MAATDLGLIKWSRIRNSEGHRTYKAKFKVQTDDTDDGPATVAVTPGHPAIGSTWTFGNDNDPWALCYPDQVIEPFSQKKGEPHDLWTVEYTFSTEPLTRCQSTSIDDPLLEPPDISGGSTKFTTERYQDRNGDPVRTSSWEQVRGPMAEVDDSRPNVLISMNVATLPLTTMTSFRDTVNDAPLWGLPARCVKLSNIRWARKLYGTCTYYYTISYEFDINFFTWDREFLDEGTKVLGKGGDKTKPEDFVLYQDINGGTGRVILKEGEIWDGTGSPGTIGPVEYYDQSNFLLLGIPTTL